MLRPAHGGCACRRARVSPPRGARGGEASWLLATADALVERTHQPDVPQLRVSARKREQTRRDDVHACRREQRDKLSVDLERDTSEGSRSMPSVARVRECLSPTG